MAGSPHGGAPAAPVRVAKIVRQDLPYDIQAIGNVEAYSSVAVKARVQGQILRVHIRDGQDVREGQLLFELDPAPFEEEVRLAEANIARDIAAEKQAEANVARDIAQAKTARSQAERYEELMKQGITAREQADQMLSAAEAAEASLAANRAAIESARAARKADEARLAQAKLDLSYARVVAPISGRAGFINIKEGNLVRENDATPLVSILRVQPIFVSFAVPEQELREIRRYMAAGALAVEARPPEGEGLKSTGRLDSIDNTVDSTTGTIRLKAVFSNEGLRLWPGQFVNVRLRLRVDRQALVAPSAAVQNGPQGTFTWLVKPDLTVEARRIEVPRSQNERSMIGSGLEEGDTVVTEGQLRLTDGAKVEIIGEKTAVERAGVREPHA
ncbi:MAG: efflux RND transporter periplasmic adaptor subunit [Bryobacteraceae bacterium]|nr:efflux RND transporter periplasmic adaptor subunit [Bryobacteraceae bacterium]